MEVLGVHVDEWWLRYGLANLDGRNIEAAFTDLLDLYFSKEIEDKEWVTDLYFLVGMVLQNFDVNKSHLLDCIFSLVLRGLTSVLTWHIFSTFFFWRMRFPLPERYRLSHLCFKPVHFVIPRIFDYVRNSEIAWEDGLRWHYSLKTLNIILEC
jgi:hypothetical protein